MAGLIRLAYRWECKKAFYYHPFCLFMQLNLNQPVVIRGIKNALRIVTGRGSLYVSNALDLLANGDGLLSIWVWFE